MGKLSSSCTKTMLNEEMDDYEEHKNRMILEQSTSCEDVEFIMRALELDRCPYCLEYFNSEEILRHKEKGIH